MFEPPIHSEAQMPTTDQTQEANVARELIEAFNAGDWNRFKATLAPNVVYEETGTQRRTEGADAYVALCQGWKRAFPDARGTVRTTLTSGDTVAQEITWEGTQTGPLDGPGGTVPPSGKRVTAQGTMWTTVTGGKARSLRHHLDVMTLLQQIGAFGTPATAGR